MSSGPDEIAFSQFEDFLDERRCPDKGLATLVWGILRWNYREEISQASSRTSPVPASVFRHAADNCQDIKGLGLVRAGWMTAFLKDLCPR